MCSRWPSEGYVTVPAFPVDMLMHSYMFCDALGRHAVYARGLPRAGRRAGRRDR